jgi:hypothetical protein
MKVNVGKQAHGGGYRKTCQLPTSFWTFTIGREQFSLFPELTPEELVFLHRKFYSIFLLQQEASTL